MNKLLLPVLAVCAAFVPQGAAAARETEQSISERTTSWLPDSGATRCLHVPLSSLLCCRLARLPDRNHNRGAAQGGQERASYCAMILERQ